MIKYKKKILKYKTKYLKLIKEKKKNLWWKYLPTRNRC